MKTMQRFVFLTVLGAAILTSPFLSSGAEASPPGRISLAGTWRFQMDRSDAGVSGRWFEKKLEHRILLPGALQNQGYGDAISVETQWTANVQERSWFEAPEFAKYRQAGNVKIPFWLQPDKHYVGAAWYQREIEIPAAWQGRRVTLVLERTHWETRAWLDGKELGAQDSLCTPHVYELGVHLKAGRHTLTIRVDNTVKIGVGINAHSVSDHTQGNWNGMVGRMELRAGAPVWIEDAQVYPQLAARKIVVKGVIGNISGQSGKARLQLQVQTGTPAKNLAGAAREIEVAYAAGGANFEAELPVDGAPQWDEFNPQLCRLRLSLDNDKDTRNVTFGLREISVTPDKLFAINGRKSYLRGTLECCIFPLTGYPPTDLASWKRIIKICQAHGLNHIRFHSWCPPEAAFVAADEAGFYFQVEIAAWATIGDGAPIDQWLYEEARRVVKAYGNHPSFLLLAYGNEPHGAKRDEYLVNWVKYWMQTDPRRLHTSGSGWPSLPENQFHVTPKPRGTEGWIGKDYASAVKNFNCPVVVHEMGQWCVYPNFDEIKKYTGFMKAKNFEIFRDTLKANGLLDQWRDFLFASGKLQALCYKEEIEAAYRTPGVTGVQLLDLHDFPGQGTALVGILDPFWDSKGYIKPAEFKRFYNTTVPLTRMSKRVWTTAEAFNASVEIAHFGAAPMASATPYWKLIDQADKIVASGELPAVPLPVDRGIPAGQILFDCSQLKAPAMYRLAVGLKGTAFENDWTIWIYPANPAAANAKDVWVGMEFNEAAQARLTAGGKVLLLTGKLSSQHPRNSFAPVFWNRQWFPSQPRQVLGLLCDPQHPALKHFPTAKYCDWEWEDIMNQSRAMNMSDLPKTLRPIVQIIDDWNTNRRLGLVFECRVGKGKLLVCSAELEQNLDQRPAARQLRQSLLAYAGSAAFNPRTEVPPQTLSALLARARPSTLSKLGAKVISVDSEDAATGNLAAHAIDGNPDTFWHTQWKPKSAAPPHFIVIDFGREIMVRGLTYLPRQDMVNGRLAECEIYCSNDPSQWGKPVADPKSGARWANNDQEQSLKFKTPVKARYLKLVSSVDARKNPNAAIAELDVISE